MKSLLLCPSLPADQLSPKLSSSYCRQVMSSLYEGLIEERWRELNQEQGRIFNSSLFRLHSVAPRYTDCDDFRCRYGYSCVCPEDTTLLLSPSSLTLKLGLASAREGCVTGELSHLSSELAYLGYEVHRRPRVFLADTISCHVIFLTSDGLIPVVQEVPYRDQGVEERPWSLPQGNPDPGEAGVTEIKDLNPSKEEQVGTEMVRCTFRALQECLGVLTPYPTSEMRLLAVIRDPKSNHKPDLVFVLFSQLTAEDVREVHGKRSAELYRLDFIDPAAGESATNNMSSVLSFVLSLIRRYRDHGVLQSSGVSS
eukprot:sb/3467088/